MICESHDDEKFSPLLSLLLARPSRQKYCQSSSPHCSREKKRTSRGRSSPGFSPVFRRIVPSAADGPIAPRADAHLDIHELRCNLGTILVASVSIGVHELL